MSWLRIDDKFAHHPKVLALTDREFRAHMLALCYAAEYDTGGTIPRSAWRTLQISNRQVERFSTLGLWEEHNGEYRIHDWRKYNPIDPTSAERKARHRAKTNPDRNETGTDEERPRNAPGTPTEHPTERPGNAPHAPARAPVPVPSRTSVGPTSPLIPSVAEPEPCGAGSGYEQSQNGVAEPVDDADADLDFGGPDLEQVASLIARTELRDV